MRASESKFCKGMMGFFSLSLTAWLPGMQPRRDPGLWGKGAALTKDVSHGRGRGACQLVAEAVLRSLPAQPAVFAGICKELPHPQHHVILTTSLG